MSYLDTHLKLITDYMDYLSSPHKHLLKEQMYERIIDTSHQFREDPTFLDALKSLPPYLSSKNIKIGDFHVVIELPHVTNHLQTDSSNFPDNVTLGICCAKRRGFNRVVFLFPVDAKFSTNQDHDSYLYRMKKEYDVVTLFENAVIVRLDGSLVITRRDTVAPFSYDSRRSNIFSYFGADPMSREQLSKLNSSIYKPTTINSLSFLNNSL